MTLKKATKKTDAYWQEGLDSKKLMLRFLSKIWLVIAGVVAGIIIGIVAYFVYHSIVDKITPEVYSLFYLDFATDEKDEAYQYYNGYTWNELMSTDLIATKTLEELGGQGIDLAKIEADTYAEIKSDIRVLRVTFTDEDIAVCERLQGATEKSMEALGQSAKEFNQITTIKSAKPYRVYADDRLFQAALLGAIIGLIITLIILWIMNILRDEVMVPSDIYDLNIPILGITLKNPDDNLSKKINDILGSVDMESASKAGEVLEVPYNKVSKSLLTLEINALRNQGKEISGIIITQADNKFYKWYLF